MIRGLTWRSNAQAEPRPRHGAKLLPKTVRNSTPPGIPRERWVKQVSARLRRLRKWLGLSEQERVVRLDTSVRAYWEYERGQVQWSDFSLPLKVAAAAGASPDWLIHGAHYPGPPKARVQLDERGRPKRLVVVSNRKARE